MKKVIFQMSVSVDGYIEGPHHEIDWHLVDDEFNAYAVEMLEASDALIMGRRTYELMARYWPTDTETDPVVRAKMNSAEIRVSLTASRNFEASSGVIARISFRACLGLRE